MRKASQLSSIQAVGCCDALNAINNHKRVFSSEYTFEFPFVLPDFPVRHNRALSDWPTLYSHVMESRSARPNLGFLSAETQ